MLGNLHLKLDVIYRCNLNNISYLSETHFCISLRYKMLRKLHLKLDVI